MVTTENTTHKEWAVVRARDVLIKLQEAPSDDEKVRLLAAEFDEVNRESDK